MGDIIRGHSLHKGGPDKTLFLAPVRKSVLALLGNKNRFFDQTADKITRRIQKALSTTPGRKKHIQRGHDISPDGVADGATHRVTLLL
jgi:hypothetical protein